MTNTTHIFNGKPRLRYVEMGSGPALLMLHGVTRGWGDWDPLVASLTNTWRVIVLEQRGHGESARADSYLVTDYVADAIRFTRDEIAGPVVVFGHSLGAMVAAAVAAELPEIVRSIVLEDPPFHTMGNRIPDTSWQALFVGMREAARKRGNIHQLAEALANIQLPAVDGQIQRLGELRSSASLAWSAECLENLDPEVLTPVIDGCWLDGFDVSDILTHVRCPALILQADPSAGGALTDDDASAAVSSMILGQRVQFSGMGHQLHRDCTAEVLQSFRSFIESLNDKKHELR
ncbi:MAG: alpha/beta hydrolase [Rubripirellula sp.]|nr:alpha/beta hydrolase [Rubripirellula sp.]